MTHWPLPLFSANRVLAMSSDHCIDSTTLGDPTPLLTDNESALALAKDPRFHARAKHINTRCHYIRECIDDSNIYLSYVNTSDNIADIFTKPLPAPTFL